LFTPLTGALDPSKPLPAVFQQLAEFEKAERARQSAAGGSGSGSGSGAAAPAEEADLQAMLAQFKAQMDQLAAADPSLKAAAAPSASAASAAAPASTASASAASSASASASASSASTTSSSSSSAAAAQPPLDFATSIDAAMKMLSEGAQSAMAGGAGGAGAAGAGALPNEEMLSKLFEEFEKLDPKLLDSLAAGAGAGAGAGAAGGAGAGAAAGPMGGIDALVQSMMGQMMSKDYLYPPMKDIANKVRPALPFLLWPVLTCCVGAVRFQYPEWLKANRASLSEADYKNFTKQLECFQVLLPPVINGCTLCKC
jgi:hypothetical protein